jgi:hypothetical protein
MDNRHASAVSVACGIGGIVLAIFPPTFFSELPLLSKWIVWTCAFFLIAISIAAQFAPKWFSIDTAGWLSRSKRADDKFVLMPEAAGMAYGELRALGLKQAEFADELAMQGMSEKVFMAAALGYQVPIYGKHPPSDIYEVINKNEFKRGVFKDEGSSFQYYHEQKPLYVDIAIKRGDLRSAIENMKGVEYVTR